MHCTKRVKHFKDKDLFFWNKAKVLQFLFFDNQWRAIYSAIELGGTWIQLYFSYTICPYQGVT